MNQIAFEKAHYRRIQQYMKQIDGIFDQGVKEAAKIGATFDSSDLFSKPFKFDDYPQTKQRIDKLMNKMQSEIQHTVVNGCTAEWEKSNFMNDKLAQEILGFKNPKDIEGNFKKYFNNNNQALEAFIKRKDSGMNLSDRVWKYTDGFKKEIEAGLDLGIRSGQSAADMARDLKQYLREPDKLFRRVRDQQEKLQLSNPAKAYHPGQGVYRSSYKNALRLARTETNMAYRTAESERIKQLDFVVGIEVRLTNNPGHVTDICDDLKGMYPKDFKFVGWHPNCMCHAVTILKTPEELEADVEKIEAGEATDTNSQNEVRELPKNFKSWAAENEERIQTAKTTPYFIRDNFKGTDVKEWWKDAPQAAKTTPAIFNYDDATKATKVWFNTLQDEEKTHVKKYTGLTAYKWNAQLRGLEKQSENITKQIARYNEIMSKAPVFEGTTYRGLGFDLLDNGAAKMKAFKKQLETGVYEEMGFFSATVSKDQALRFANTKTFKVILEIEDSKGVAIQEISKIKKEKEILTKPGTKYKVISQSEKDGILTVKLRLIEAKKRK